MDDYSTLYPPQNPMGQFLNDPGMAMAGSAINNMMQMRRGMAPQSNPFQVLQEQQRRNAILQNQRYQQIEQKKLRDLQMQGERQKLNPFFEYEQAIDRGYIDPQQVSLIDYENLSGSSSRPMSVKEWEYYSKLTPAQQVEYRDMKRAATWKDRGPELVRPDTGETIPIDLAPNETPQHKQEVASATEQGKTEGQKTSSAPARLEQIDTMLAMIQQLKGNKSLDAIYGVIDQWTPTVRQESKDTKAEVDNLVAKLILDEREKLKGQGTISDFESRMLGSAATLLQDFGISSDKAREELERVEGILNEARSRTEPLTGAKDGWKVERVK